NQMLKIIGEDSDIHLSDIEILTATEKQQLLGEINATEKEYSRDTTIIDLFEEQADRVPEHTAVIFGDSRLTYRELNAKANQLARTLRDRGIGANRIVPVMMERSLDMMVGIIAILKA